MGKKYSDELYHYRTVGSKNGYSKDPNYRPVGQPAMNLQEYQRKQNGQSYAKARAVDYKKAKDKAMVEARNAGLRAANATKREVEARNAKLRAANTNKRNAEAQIKANKASGKYDAGSGSLLAKQGRYGKAGKAYAKATYNAAKSGNLKSALGYAGKAASNYAKKGSKVVTGLANKGYKTVKNTYLALKKKGTSAIKNARSKIAKRLSKR